MQSSLRDTLYIRASAVRRPILGWSTYLPAAWMAVLRRNCRPREFGRKMWIPCSSPIYTQTTSDGIWYKEVPIREGPGIGGANATPGFRPRRGRELHPSGLPLFRHRDLGAWCGSRDGATGKGSDGISWCRRRTRQRGEKTPSTTRTPWAVHRVAGTSCQNGMRGFQRLVAASPPQVLIAVPSRMCYDPL